MKYCVKCGKELVDEAIICTGCGCSCGKSVAAVQSCDDTVNVGLCVLAALIPLFGFIYWPVTFSKTPKKAKACGITALVAFAIYFVFLMLADF